MCAEGLGCLPPVNHSKNDYLGEISKRTTKTSGHLKQLTVLQHIDKDNFGCPELGVVQKCSMILGEYQSPGGKFF